ncbi:MAG: VOC family protein [Verrucomicrobia bacterium]|nr:VOC family protein [Verrucomicrobiota bacterium]
MSQSSLPKLQHVTITYRPTEKEQLKAFYTKVLGFREKPVPKVVQPLGWVWFNTADPAVELHCVPDEALVSANSRHHFCVEIDDLEDQRERLKKAGCAIVEAKPLPFRPRFFSRDPFGNLIEFVKVEGDYVSAGEAAELN